MAEPTPTTWKIAPAAATEDMRRSAAHILRLYTDGDVDIDMHRAMVIAGNM